MRAQLVEFYLDESESGDGRWLCVAGWLFTREGREALHEEWSALLCRHRLPYFHMADCAHGIKQFRRFDKPACEALQRRFFEALKRHALVGFCATYDLTLAHLCPNAVDRSGERFHVTPYTLCCYWVLLHARVWANYTRYSGKISYFFEAGHASQRQANRMMGEVFSNPKLREIFRYSAHGFVDKKQCAAVQTADILAWLWGKSVKDRHQGKMKPRADLWALMTAIPCGTVHFDEKVIREFVAEVRGYTAEEHSGFVSAKAIATLWSGVMAGILPSYWSGRSPWGWLPH